MGEFKGFKPSAEEKKPFRISSFSAKDDKEAGSAGFSPSPIMRGAEAEEAPEPAEPEEPEVPEEPEEPEEPPEPEIDVEQLQQEAYDLGMQDVRDALEPQIDRLEQQLDLVQPLIHQLVTMRKETLQQAAKDVAEIVLLTARRVVGDSLAYNPEALPTLVEAAIEQMPDEDEIIIKVAPDDVPCVQDALDEAFRENVVASEDVEAGCIVETKFASIDSSLEAVVAGLESAVAEWLESENA